MDSLFALAGILGTTAVMVTAKLQNTFKPKGKVLNYLLAFGVSTGLVLLSKYAGFELGLPDVSDRSWLNLGIVDLFVFAMAGGFWDLLKIVGIRKPK